MAGSQRRSRGLFVRGAFAAAVLTAAVMVPLSHTRAFRWLESGSYDARVRWSANPAEADRGIVIIDIDNASFSQLKEMFGRWPWTRGVYTETIRYVNRGHPRAIAFDSIFGGTETAEVDGELAQVARRAGNVVFGFTLNPAETDEPQARDHKLKLLERDSSPIGPKSLADPYDPNDWSLNVPADVLAEAAAGMGSVNTIVDSDGVIRRLAIGYKLGDKIYPPLSVRTTDIAEHKAASSFERSGRQAIHNGWRVPVDPDGHLLLLWHGDEFVYERIPYWKMFCSIFPQQCPNNKIYFKPDYFRDRIVLMGSSATASYEARATPFDEQAPGFIVQATAINNLLHREGVRVAPGWFLPVAVVALALIGAAILVGVPSGAVGAALAVLTLASYGGLTYAAFARWHLWLPFVAPAGALVVSFASASAIRYATTGRELKRMRGTLDRYMSPQVAAYVVDNLDNIQFAGEKRELTIMFSDVRNFTSLTERSEPLDLIALLNEYLHEMTDVIFKYGDGVVDKFIGDGILAYWGAFTPGNHALLAAQAALEMFDRLKELNERWAAQGKPNIDIGVGINTGEVIFGEVGAGKKLEFTIIGDAVNLAARLESLNKERKTHIIVSEFTLAKLGDAATVRPMGGVTVKGKSIETAIFELQALAGAQAAPAIQAAHNN
jgi:adenylate cyclase